MRKSTPDFIPRLLANLSNITKEKNEALQESIDSDGDSQHISGSVTALEQADQISKAINGAFADLKDDYRNGRIPMARYTPYLKNLKEYFESDMTKGDVPECLITEEMIQEIEKYVGKVDVYAKPQPEAIQVKPVITEKEIPLKKSVESTKLQKSFHDEKFTALVNESIEFIERVKKEVEANSIELKKRMSKKHFK